MGFDPTVYIAFQEKGPEVKDLKSEDLDVPFDSRVYENQGKKFLEEGDLKKAESFLVKALVKAPWNDRLHSALGNLYLKANKIQAAVQEFQSSLNLNPHSEEALLGLSLASFMMGDFEKSFLYPKKILEFSPESDDAFSWLGVLSLKKGEFLKALQSFEMALNINPNNLTAHLGRGHAFAAAGLLKDAVFSFEKAVESSPESVEAYTGLRDCLEFMGEKEQAERISKFLLKMKT
jgi:tetratricopeptide (TPR) repeat protein